MTKIEFNAEELELLHIMLERGVNSMEVEISHTDSHEFKQMLKHRKEILEGMRRKVEAVPIAA